MSRHITSTHCWLLVTFFLGFLCASAGEPNILDLWLAYHNLASFMYPEVINMKTPTVD